MSNIFKKIATALVGATMLMGLVSVVPATHAATQAELQAQLAALQAQLAALNGNQTAHYNFTVNLTVGSTGSDVTALQTILIEGGYLHITAPTGYFGLLTKAAVAAWQLQAGLPSTGFFGPLSRAKLNAVVVVNYPAGCTSNNGYSVTTGMSCANTAPATTPFLPGCTSYTGFSSTTGASCVPPVNPAPAPAPVGTSGVSASLATVQPNSNSTTGGNVIFGQATADLAHFTFSGTGTVSSVTLQRSGISDQNTLTNVYLYDGNNRLTDGYSFNTNGLIVMNNLGIAINGSRVISVKADVCSTCSSTASTIAVGLVGFTANGVAQVSNVWGNTFSLVVGNPATATLGTNTVTGNPTVNAGTSAYTFWSAPLQVNIRQVWLKGANFRMIGSAPADALANIGLFVDGVQVGSAATITTIGGSNYAMFDLAVSPVLLNTGSHTLDVRANVEKGSARTIQLSIQSAADITLYDAQLAVNIAVGGTMPNSAATVSINAGSATVVLDPAFQAMTTITGGATNTAIAKFKVHAYGEDVKVNTLSVTPVLTGCTPACAGLNNVTLYFNGSQVGSQQNWTSGALTFTLGSQMIAPAGVDSTLEVRADIQTNANVNYTLGSVSANLNAGTSNAQGQNSFTTLNFPSAAVNGNVLSIQTALLALSKNSGYSNQTVTPNTAGVKIGSFILQNQATSESVRVTSLNVALAFSVPTYASGTIAAGSQTWTLTNSTAAFAANTSAGITIGNVVTIASGCTGGAPVMTVTGVAATTITGTVVTNGATSCTASSAITGSGSTTGPATLTNFSALRTSETSGSGATPIQPAASNTFSVNFTLAPGATKVVDIFSDTSTANMGAVISTLTVTSIGVSSNISSTSAATVGQTITLASGTVTNPPTLVSSSSTAAQLIAAAVTGCSNCSTAVFNFQATGGSATINELKFIVTDSPALSGTVTGVTVGGVTAQPVTITSPSNNQVAYITGLNLVVPNGGSGLNVPVTVSYAPVGTNGVVSTTTSILKLEYVKYTSGGVTTTACTALVGSCTPVLVEVVAPTMTMVGSKPAPSVVDSTDALVNGQVKLVDIIVAADSHGDIKLRDLPFSVTSTGSATATGIVVKDAAGATIPTTDNTLAVTAGITDTVTVTFTGDYLIPAGTSVTFRIYTTAGGVDTADALTTSLGVNTSFMWLDVAGNNTTAINGSQIFNYPTNTSVISSAN